jgi:CubicO group peptidase (beta-lactamase class C family)
MSGPLVPERVGAAVDQRAAVRLVAAVEADIASGLYDGAVVLVALDGEIVVHEALGMADLAAGRSARVDDVFLLMSMTKAITAVAALQAIDQGLLSFQTRVAELIPEFAQKGKARVTVYHLLTHTGGVWPMFGPTPGLQPSEMGNLAAMVDGVSRTPLQSTPGQRVAYSPWAGYAILGEVVRRVDPLNRRLRDILAEDVFAPLGMSDTALGLREDLAARRVPVVLRDPTEGVAERTGLESLNDLLDSEAERPSGGAFSTGEDVLAFAEMLRNRGAAAHERVLSQAIVDFAVRNHTGQLPNTFWDSAKEMRDIPEFPANLGLGLYTRGQGVHLTPLGLTSSPSAFGAIGGGSTGFVVDPTRALSFVFLSAGFLEGLAHFQRMQRLSDLAMACAQTSAVSPKRGSLDCASQDG